MPTTKLDPQTASTAPTSDGARPARPSSLVFGRVLRPDGPPVASLEVQALHKSLRTETRLGLSDNLGKHYTNVRGFYAIPYEPPKGLRSVDLVVRAVDPQLEREVARSAVFCHARQVQLVDVIVGDAPYRGYSEFERLTHMVQPHLGDTALTAVTPEDVAFLACTARLDARLLAQLAAAHRYAERTGVPAAAFYGWIHQALPTDLPDLLSQRSRVLRDALRDAVAANVVPAALAPRFDDVVRELKQAAVAIALEVPEGQQSNSLAGLLGAAGLSAGAQTAVLSRFALHEGTTEAYWTALKEDPDVGPEMVNELQFTLQLGTLAGGYVPMVEQLRAKAKTGKLESVERFVALTEQDWLALVEQSGVPPTVPGETPAERARGYATALRTTLERAFPTPTIVAGLRRQQQEGDRDLFTFFDNSSDFAFAGNVDRYIADNADAALEGIADVPAVTRRLKGMQRLYRLAPEVNRLDAMTALTTAGVSSAQSVVRRGRESFVRAVGPALGAAAASAVFDKAEQTSAVALTLFGKYGRPLIGTTPLVMGGATTATNAPDTVTVPSWETLFGSLNSCTCEHCRSVYSPAAYLVDLLEFVRRQRAVQVHPDGTTTTPRVTQPDGTVRDKNALDVLFERRADIGDIELSCANADTELAYIDLVNEALENSVARQVAAYQTTWTAEELRANAEHLNDSAYRRLAEQVYPRSLPFNLWLLEARTYLGHLGVTLDELMDVLQRQGLSPMDQPLLEQAIAVERLTLSPQAAHIVMGTSSPGRGPGDYWGIAAADWPDALFDLPTFLRQAELSYAALVDLLSARFINPGGSITIRFETPCTTEGATIRGLTEPALDRIHRFLRLQLAVGWSTLELDAAIAAMASTDLTVEFLVQLAHISRLHEQFGTPVIECLSWWATISTTLVGEDADVTSLYDDLFLDNAVLSPVDSAFELDAGRTDLVAAGSETIGNHTPAILAALAITDAELSLALDHVALTGDDALTLDHLSKLHRTVSLARALDLPIADFLSVCALTGIDPSLSPQATLDLTERAQAIGESAFSVAELDYLLRHVYAETSGLAPADSGITLVLDGIVAALLAVASENAFVADPTGTFTQSRLALLLDADDVQTAMAIVAGTSTSPDADQGAFVDEHLAVFLDAVDAKRQLIGAAALVDRQERYEYVLRPLLAHLLTTLSTERVVQLLADALGLDVAVAEAMLTRYVATPGDPTRFTIEPFLEITPDIEEYGAELLDSYRLLHKIATVLTRLDATTDELPWLFTEGPALRWLDLTQLPLIATTDAAVVAPMFDGWQRLVALYALRDRYAAGDATIFGILDLARTGATREAVLAELATVTGWSLDDLQFLTGPDGLALTYPAQYRDERYLVRLQAAMDLLRRLGLSATQVAGWRTTGGLGETREIARDIKSTVKAKYDSDGWLTIAEPLKSPLREQQRSALTAYLIGTHEDLADTSDLYARYLIDVDMGACMTTSRIKQAHSSVQLFVQRCLMNLEPDVEITDAGAEEWRWMKLYRVWEANRKVFLYPETYIEPDLRDDKSPFFEELENELLQNEVTAGAAETALVNYLLKLGEVSNLDVRALVHEQSEGESPRDVLHVMARTHNAPHIYYYRTRVDASYWTPWERVNVDVQGDHLLAVVWNGRLNLMWPLFREVGDEQVTVTHENEVEPTSCPSLISLLEGQFLGVLIAEEYEDAWEYFKPTITDELVPELTAGLSDPPFDFQAAAALYKSTMEALFKGVNFDAFDGIIDSWVDCRKAPAPSPTTTTTTTLENRWEIQLAWAEYRDGAWSAKKVSEEAIAASSGPSAGFMLKPEITVVAASNGSSTVDEELTVACFGTNSNSRVKRGSFRFTGCGGQVIATSTADATAESAPLRPTLSQLTGMRFVELGGVDGPLTLVSSTVDEAGDWTGAAQEHITALNLTPGQFRVPVPHQYNEFVLQDEFFYQDETRSFHVSPRLTQFGAIKTVLQDRALASYDVAMKASPRTATSLMLPRDVDASLTTGEPSSRADTGERSIAPGTGIILGQTSDVLLDTVYRFNTFHHPHACTLLKEINAAGPSGMMQRSVQALSDDDFDATYDPVESVVPTPYPLQNIDFSYAAAYVGYNWEAFFHAPLLIATRLSENQRFEEAQRWFHYIFNPTLRTDAAGVTGPERYWVFHPFYLETLPQDLTALMEGINAGDPALEAQVAQWRAAPFNPHLIARLRPGAYQKTVVMKYLDNLIAWGDALFRQDTIETLNEATQLYILAADILGPHPEPLPAIESEDSETYNTLAERLDDFSNALVTIEDALPAENATWQGPIVTSTTHEPLPFPPIDVQLPTPQMLYFCIPDNDELLSYWSTVGDRLFNIRNCMNIEGVVRQLPLYEPPIDPALLVRAAAAGVDLSSALSDLYAPLPAYRFQVMLQRAVEFCSDVRSLGAALLGALEKQDAEELALLRANHETEALGAVRSIRERQVEEAAKGLESVEKSRGVVEGRRQYYATLCDDDLSTFEQAQLTLLEDANRITLNAQSEEHLANVLYAFPQLMASFPPESEFGGIHLGQAAQAVARWHGSKSVQKSYEANRASLNGGHARRRTEWRFQLDSAERELTQLDTQLAAAQLRVAIAENELTNHDAQAARATAVRDVMIGKFTTGELYGWMASQVAALYSQSYQLAYDLAKRAEKAYEHELGVSGAGFIQFGYWDSLKKGLLAGEKLHNDLRRMDAAFLENDTREYELTKHVSLAMIDPVALVKLRREGVCYVQLPEALFDLDGPGQYMRRLKTVSLTIPSVAGPYAGIHCKLSLESSSVRVSAATSSITTGASYLRKAPLDADERFRDELGVSQSMVVSLGQNDHGLFELNLNDPRYFPFERRGAISAWKLELTNALASFDSESISDVVIGLRYTARDGGETLKQECLDDITDALTNLTTSSGAAGLMQGFSVRHEFADAWYRFVNPTADASSQTLELPIDETYFPYRFQGSDIRISAVSLYLLPKQDADPPLAQVSLDLNLANGGNASVDLTPTPQPTGSHAFRPYLSADGVALAGRPDAVTLSTSDVLTEQTIENLILILSYEISPS